MTDFSMERWVAIPGYEGEYEVSDMGKVRSLDKVKTHYNPRWNCNITRAYKGRIKKDKNHSTGYRAITLGKGETHLVHRLVMLSFVGEPPEGKPWVNHKNGDKADNRLCNLEWSSLSENQRHRFDVLGKTNRPKDPNWVNPRRIDVTNPSIVERGKQMKDAGFNQRHIAAALGISRSAVQRYIAGS